MRNEYIKKIRWKILFLTLASIFVCGGSGFLFDYIFDTGKMGFVIGIGISVFVAQGVVFRFVRRYLKENPIVPEETEK